MGLLGVFVAWKLGLNAAMLKGWLDSLVEYLEARPAMIFIAIAVLPSMPFPASVLLLVAGVVYGERFGPFYSGLIALTASKNVALAWEAITALGVLGPTARAAETRLEELSKIGDHSVSTRAAIALRAIRPRD